MNDYESDELLDQYLAFHYGDTYFGVGNYPARCAALCRELMGQRPKRTALDLGCAVGRSTFELAKDFDHVTGVDLSRRFIESARLMRQRGEVSYFLRDQGELGSSVLASLRDIGLVDVVDRVTFTLGDACRLGPEHRGYDLIFAGNLIDRLEDPRAFLASLHRYLDDEGVLVISSPYTLMEAFTPRENWIGGYRRNGEPVTVLDGMREILAPHFALIQEPVDMPFVIRETRRKFQHTVAEATAWQRIV
ncbi:putative 4-mercaptohistidine N1-methyltransferase [Halomonas cerina]|uniref:Putative 4-mercaptohistidine N1-methyltransferase n=1 Tax=Halomonas cerina TaxID=447424 RepID=A0A839V8F7_9GAMM|nr:putative 4-mercaptohistidine N1-methyltransferase [Halomonas cerina]MBB3189769.1 putative 4-mercaptohistidine N1-methyltransferase [Halomonas cerina]